MDWQAISAVGSLLCAVAAFFAALVALVMGCSERKMSVYARGIIFEDDHYDLFEHHPNCFNIEIICDGNQPVYITHVIEGARYKKNACGAKGWLKSRTRIRECGTLSLMQRRLRDHRVAEPSLIVERASRNQDGLF